MSRSEVAGAHRPAGRLGYEQILSCLTERSLRLILMPTEACNFRCVYCYEDFRLGKMRPEVVRGVKNLLRRQVPGLDRLELSWFGGEPLLARGVMEDVLAHVRDLLAAQPRVRFTSDVTTNAYRLDEPLFRRLLELGVTGYQVTLDGPREWHDRRRLRADGAGTFDVIWRNLRTLSGVPGEFGVSVRLHVDAENHVALPAFLDRFRDAFGADPRFSLFIRRVERLGGPNDALLPVLDERALAPVLRSARACADERGLQAELEGDRRTICYAVRANAFVVRADGRLNKCTVALSHPANDVGRLEENGDIRLHAGRSRPWMRGLFSHDLDELECPMQGFAEPSAGPHAVEEANCP